MNVLITEDKKIEIEMEEKLVENIEAFRKLPGGEMTSPV